MIKRILDLVLSKPQCPALGRWKLKHQCLTEDIAVFNANRDHCGDILCGNQEEYKKMVPKKPDNNSRNNGNR